MRVSIQGVELVRLPPCSYTTAAFRSNEAAGLFARSLSGLGHRLRDHGLKPERSGRAIHDPPEGVRHLKPSRTNEDNSQQLPAFKRPIGRPQVTKGRRGNTPAALKRTRDCPQQKLSPSAVATATDQRGGRFCIQTTRRRYYQAFANPAHRDYGFRTDAAYLNDPT